MTKKRRYLTLGLASLAVTVVFAVLVCSGALQYPYACWLIGSEHVHRDSNGSLVTDRPDGADEQLPIVTRTVDGVTGPYMTVNSNAEKSEP